MKSNNFINTNVKLHITLKKIIGIFAQGLNSHEYKIINDLIIAGLPAEIKRLESKDLQKTIMNMLNDCK